MTPLRQRMVDAMVTRDFAARTQESYVEPASRMARHYHRSPALLSKDEVSDLNEAIQIIESGEGELHSQQRALLGISGSLGGAKPKVVDVNYLDRSATTILAGGSGE